MFITILQYNIIYMCVYICTIIQCMYNDMFIISERNVSVVIINVVSDSIIQYYYIFSDRVIVIVLVIIGSYNVQ